MRQPDPISFICSLGSSPAVVTEALYALHKHEGIVPDRLLFITTGHGRTRLITMRDSQRAEWEHLCELMAVSPADFTIPTANILVPSDTDGNPLNDLQSYEDNLRYADLIQETVRRECAYPKRKVIACIAGGRKTMSAHLHSAMQFFGRTDDRIVHVLVSEPFERIPGFLYPEQLQAELTLPGDTAPIKAAYAEVNLIDIPFIPLGGVLSSSSIDVGNQGFADIQAQARGLLDVMGSQAIRRLHLDVQTKELALNIYGEQHRIRLRPMSLTLMLYLGLTNAYHKTPKPVQLIHIGKTGEKQDLSQIAERIKFLVCMYLANNNSPEAGYDIHYNFSKYRSDLVKQLSDYLAYASTPIPVSELLTFDAGKSDRELKANLLPVSPALITYHFPEIRVHIAQEEIRTFVMETLPKYYAKLDEKKGKMHLTPPQIETIMRDVSRFFEPILPIS
jgi:CRISPR-associated protein (TIGR02584 family)